MFNRIIELKDLPSIVYLSTEPDELTQARQIDILGGPIH